MTDDSSRDIDITPRHPGYTGPKMTLIDRGGSIWIARADDPRIDPWILLPARLLRYIDIRAIWRDGDAEAAWAYNDAIDAAGERQAE